MFAEWIYEVICSSACPALLQCPRRNQVAPGSCVLCCDSIFSYWGYVPRFNETPTCPGSCIAPVRRGLRAALSGQAGLPRDVLDRLNKEVAQVVKQAGVKLE